jgi:hypothetical protein
MTSLFGSELEFDSGLEFGSDSESNSDGSNPKKFGKMIWALWNSSRSSSTFSERSECHSEFAASETVEFSS